MSEVPLWQENYGGTAMGQDADDDAASRPPLKKQVFFLFSTLVTGPRRSLSLKLSDTRVSNMSPPRNHCTFL